MANNICPEMYHSDGQETKSDDRRSLGRVISPSRQNQLMNSLSASENLIQRLQLNATGLLPPGLLMAVSPPHAQIPQYSLGGYASEAVARRYLAHVGEIQQQHLLDRLIGGGLSGMNEDEVRRELEHQFILRDSSGIGPLNFSHHLSTLDSFREGPSMLTRSVNRDIGLDYQLPRRQHELTSQRRLTPNSSSDSTSLGNGLMSKRKAFSSSSFSNLNQEKLKKLKKNSLEKSTPDTSTSSNDVALSHSKTSLETELRSDEKTNILRGQSVDKEDHDLHTSDLGTRREGVFIRKTATRKRPTISEDIRFPSYHQLWTDLKEKVVKNYPRMDKKVQIKVVNDLFMDSLHSGDYMILKEGFGWSKSHNISGKRESS